MWAPEASTTVTKGGVIGNSALSVDVAVGGIGPSRSPLKHPDAVLSLPKHKIAIMGESFILKAPTRCIYTTTLNTQLIIKS